MHINELGFFMEKISSPENIKRLHKILNVKKNNINIKHVLGAGLLSGLILGSIKKPKEEIVNAY